MVCELKLTQMKRASFFSNRSITTGINIFQLTLRGSLQETTEQLSYMPTKTIYGTSIVWVYIYWEQVHDPNNVELEVELNEADRAYLNGLLIQRFGKEIES